LIWGEGLLAEASWRDFVAISTDDPAGYGIIDTSTCKGCAEKFADNESASNLPEFLITQKAGADPAKHAVCFHITLLS
jgi:hypothetical protein